MAEELIEIILQAVDNASSIFSSVTSSAEEIGTTMADVGDKASDSFDEMGQSAQQSGDSLQTAFEEATAEVERLEEALNEAHLNGDDIEADIIADELAEAEAEAERLAEAMGSISDNGGLEDAAGAADELEQEVNEATQAFEELNNTAGDVKAADTLMDISTGVASSMMSMVEASGNFSDSMMRASLEAEGFGISADQMKATVSELSEATGRAGGQIRESFITATARGVTDIDSFKKMMEGAGAQATLFGTDIESMANKFSGLAAKATISEKFLANMGITMGELGQAMGMTGATADEVKEKWKQLDTNQRAAALGMAASMNEGKNANEAYKNSWAGMQEQLDIARGKLERLVGDVLAPTLIPAIQLATSVLQGLGDVLSGALASPLGGLISLLGTLGGAFVIAVTGVGALKSVLGFLRIEATLTAIETTALTMAEELQGGASLASAAANAIGATGFAGLATAAWGAATAVWALLAPFLPFIAAAAVAVVAIYEIGKAFGWWKDIGTMFEAIKAGIMRMWDAFINHPDVQAVINAITTAWNALVSAIGTVISAIGEFFGIANTGEFDIVAVLIEGIGLAWEALTFPLHSVIGLMQLLYPIMESFFNNNLVPFGEFLVGVFTPVWNLLMSVFSAIMPYVTNLTNAFTQFANGQMTLPSLIMAVLTSLWNIYTTILTRIVTAVLNWGRQIVSNAISAVTSFVNNIMTRIQQLPGRVLSALLQVVSSIVSAGVQWVSNAKSQASSIVSGVVGILTGLPGQISSALAGVVSAITSPFQSAYNAVVGVVNNIKSQVQDAMNAIGQLNPFAQGGEVIAAGGESLDVYGNRFDIRTGRSTDKLDVEVNEHIILDFVNVPAHIDTDTLAKAIQDRDVLKALTTNRTFQDLDANIKSKIEARNNRSRGA